MGAVVTAIVTVAAFMIKVYKIHLKLLTYRDYISSHAPALC